MSEPRPAAECPQVVDALRGLLDNPYGCAWCDFGVLRTPDNPAKDHDPDCSWVRAQDALKTY